MWAPLAATAVVIAHFALPDTAPAVEEAGLVVLTVVFGYLGVQVLRTTDAAWDAVPSAARTETPVTA